MKKIFALLFAFMVMFAACDKSDDETADLEKENERLKKILAENAKIVDLKFSDDKMTVIFSTGDEVTLPIPEELKGKDGENGKDGKDGNSPRVGDNGNWWIGDTDTGVKAKGQDGEDGKDGKDGNDGQDGKDGENGKDGQNGKDGNTPKIGDNGNWWIDGKDTGIKAKGPKGADGTGIESITYDKGTSTLRIKLTNGQTTSFVIYVSGDSLSAKLVQDLNGKYFVEAIMMGDVPVAKVTYNEN